MPLIAEQSCAHEILSLVALQKSFSFVFGHLILEQRRWVGNRVEGGRGEEEISVWKCRKHVLFICLT